MNNNTVLPGPVLIPMPREQESYHQDNQPNDDVTVTVVTQHQSSYLPSNNRRLENQNHDHDVRTTSTASQLARLASNDYNSNYHLNHHHPLVTRTRIFWFFLSHVTFMCAFGFFRETNLYITTLASSSHNRAINLEISLFCFATLVHELFLFGLFFTTVFNAAFRSYRAHWVWKSLGELAFMIVASLLQQFVLLRGLKRRRVVVVESGSSTMSTPEVASALTSVLLTFYSLCVINLLKPGYHYSIFEVTATLTVHLSMDQLKDGMSFLSWSVIFVVFVILLVKNFLWHGVNGRH